MFYLEDRIIGKSLSRIALGVSKFGSIIQKDISFQMLDYYFQKGGTVIDTARNYYEWTENGRGKSESCIGEWIESRKNREKICLCTKGGVSGRGDNLNINLDKESLLDEVQKSKEALRTQYLDIYLLHRDQEERTAEEIIDTMQELKERENIRRIGVANWSLERIKAANQYAERRHLTPFTVIQTWWSLGEYKPTMWNDPHCTHMDEDIYQYLIQNELIGMAYTSQCKGFFQKAVELGITNLDDFLKERILTARNAKKAEFIREYCNREKISPTALVTGYITSDKAKGIALVSCSNIRQLKDIMENSDYNVPEKIINQLNNI